MSQPHLVLTYSPAKRTVKQTEIFKLNFDKLVANCQSCRVKKNYTVYHFTNAFVFVSQHWQAVDQLRKEMKHFARIV
jgi:hypothetical protein